MRIENIDRYVRVIFPLYLILCLGCQCNSSVRSPEAEIEAMLIDVEKAFEVGDLESIKDRLSDEYSGEGAMFGGAKANLIRGLQVLFLRRGQRFVVHRVESIIVDDEQRHAQVKLYAILTHLPVRLEALTTNTKGDILAIQLQLEYNSKWKVHEARWGRVSLLKHLDKVLGR